VGVDHRRFYIFVPKKFLNGPYVIYMDVVYVGFAGAKTDRIHSPADESQNYVVKYDY